MKRLFLAAAAVVAMACSGAAMARVDVGISIGIPGIIYSQPDYYYPPVRYVEPPRVIVVPESYYRPARVYRTPPRYYRDDFRGHRGHKAHKHAKHKGRGHHGHRHGHR